jgi:hypothetical protein
MPIGNAPTDVGLEAHEVVVQQRPHDPLVDRQGREDLGRREGRVQEEAHALPQAELAQLLRERDQVEVVHPDEVVRLQEPRQSRGEARVDVPVDVELRPLEAHQVDAEVQQRPQAVVAEAVVVAVVLVLREVERRAGDAGGLLGLQARLVRARQAAAPAEPQPAALPQRIDEPDGEAARGRRAAHRPDAVRDGDEAGGRLHVKASQPRERRMAAFTMPTSEYVCG